MGNELSGRLGALGEEAGEDDGRNAADGNHDSPAVGGIGQGGAEGVGNKLTESDAEVVEGNHAASVFRRSKFTDVEGLYVLEWRILSGGLMAAYNDHGSGTDTQTDDEATNRHLDNGKGRSLDYGSDKEEEAANVDSQLSAKLVSGQASNQGADEGASRRQGCDELLLVGRQFVAEIVANGDQDGGNDTSIIT